MIRQNDTVMVMTGREKGKTGKVISLLRKSDRAVVEKLNMVKKHQKPNQTMKQGGVIDKESSIHISNLLIYCTKCKKGVRTGLKVEKDGKKSRLCKKCGGSLG